MKNFQKVLMAAVLLLGFMPRAHAAEIFKNDDLDLSFGGRYPADGDMELVTADLVSEHVRVFLWDEEDRLFTSGNYQGYKWNFEVAFGGEAINSSNNQLNLLDASADIPLIPDMVTVKVGQFKVPGNLESADYEGNQLFTEKSPIFNLFFNQGYDTGLALFGTCPARLERPCGFEHHRRADRAVSGGEPEHAPLFQGREPDLDQQRSGGAGRAGRAGTGPGAGGPQNERGQAERRTVPQRLVAGAGPGRPRQSAD